MSINTCFMYLGAPLLGVCMLQVCIYFLYRFFYHCVLSFFIFLYGLCFIFLFLANICIVFTLYFFVCLFCFFNLILFLKSVWSDMSIDTLAFLWFPLSWTVFFYLSTLSTLCVSFTFNWVSFRWHMSQALVSLSSLALCVFWLKHLIHWHLR